MDLCHHLIFCDLAVDSDRMLFSCLGIIGLLFLRAIPSQVSSWLTRTIHSTLSISTPIFTGWLLRASLWKRIWLSRSVESPPTATDLPYCTFFPEKLDLLKISGEIRKPTVGLNFKRQIVSLFCGPRMECISAAKNSLQEYVRMENVNTKASTRESLFWALTLFF